MRLKVEIEWQGKPWSKVHKIRWMAGIDAVFGLLVATLYVIKLCFPALEPEFYTSDLSPDRWNTMLALVFLIAANLLQTFHSLRLNLMIKEKPNRDPAICFEPAKTWFDFTQFSYLFMVVKCIIAISYIFKVAPCPWMVVLTAITFPECIFKFYMMYTVFGFMKDLKQSLKYMPKFHFIPYYIDTSLDIESMDKVDINANTETQNLV